MATMTVRRLASWLGRAAVLASTSASAEDSAGEATRAATNALPVDEQIKLTPSYALSHGNTRYRAELQLEAVLPYQGLLIPDLDVEDVWSVARFQLTAESLQNAQGTASGFENLNLVDLAARRFGSLTLGLGFGTVFPMATSAAHERTNWRIARLAAPSFHDGSGSSWA